MGAMVNLDHIYIAILVALAAYATAIPDAGIVSFLAFYSFSYVLLSTLALLITGISALFNAFLQKRFLGGLWEFGILLGLSFMSFLILWMLLAGFLSDLQERHLEMGAAVALSIYSMLSASKVPKHAIQKQERPSSLLHALGANMDNLSKKLSFAGGTGFLLSILLLSSAFFFNTNPKDITSWLLVAGIFLFPLLFALFLEERLKKQGLYNYRLLIYLFLSAILVIASGISHSIFFSFLLTAHPYQKMSLILGGAYLAYFVSLVSRVPWKYFEEKEPEKSQ